MSSNMLIVVLGHCCMHAILHRMRLVCLQVWQSASLAVRGARLCSTWLCWQYWLSGVIPMGTSGHTVSLAPLCGSPLPSIVPQLHWLEHASHAALQANATGFEPANRQACCRAFRRCQPCLLR